MRPKTRLPAVAGALVFAVTAGGPATATAPPITSTTIVGDPHGFGPVAEIVTGHGTVVDTFRGSLGTIKLVGTPGSSMSIDVAAPDAHGRGSIRVRLSGRAPKTGGAGPSQRQNLADLGVASGAATPVPAEVIMNAVKRILPGLMPSACAASGLVAATRKARP